MKKFISFLLFTTFVLTWKQCDFNFFPIPQECIISNQEAVLKNPCSILYKLNGKSQSHAHTKQILDHYQQKTFKCSAANILYSQIQKNINPSQFEYTVDIKIVDSKLRSVFTIQEESYTLNATINSAIISAPTYVGFVRALQTFTQIPQCSRSLRIKACNLTKMPIYVKDQPQFVYRGLMIDTSRHFLPFHQILETIDAMMYNKMNVLHWHITDQDSFPLILDSHPQIAKYGAFSEQQTYTSKEARQVVRYAMIRGIRVIPQLDTPGHAASWGLAPQNKEIACAFRGYMGPLDVTMQKTYKVLREVFTEIDKIFVDPIIHFGGDEVSLTCLKNQTAIRVAQNNQNINFEMYYRKRQRKIMKEINPKKNAMYWMNNQNIDIQQTDVVHWWGSGYPKTNKKIVISHYGPYYLDMGVGNYFGVSYGGYITWLDFYNRNLQNQIRSYENKANVLGAQACLWSEISNRYTHHLKIWIRTSSLAQRLWNSKITNIKPGVTRRITAHERLMNRRGIPTAPATCQQCQFRPQNC